MTIEEKINDLILNNIYFSNPVMKPVEMNIIAFHTQNKNKSVDTLKGIAVIYNHQKEYHTAEIQLLQSNKKIKLMDRRSIVKLFDHLFDDLKLKKVISKVSSEQKYLVESLKRSRWRFILNPNQYNKHDEYIFYMFDYDWRESKPYYTRSYTELKAFYEKHTADTE